MPASGGTDAIVASSRLSGTARVLATAPERSCRARMKASAGPDDVPVATCARATSAVLSALGCAPVMADQPAPVRCAPSQASPARMAGSPAGTRAARRAMMAMLVLSGSASSDGDSENDQPSPDRAARSVVTAEGGMGRPATRRAIMLSAWSNAVLP